MQSSNLHMRGLHEQVCVPEPTLLFSGGNCGHSLKLFAEGHPTMPRIQTTEDRRLEEARIRKKHWKRWGPYLSERQWGTVREDYSPGGTAWEFFPHDHARSRAYRWGEDGLGGISDRHQMLCFGLALWNGRDPILKERLFGLTGNQGNHGEDVKEYYFYLDSTPTHSYMRMLYKYPQRAFPYADLVETNRRRGRHEPEYELIDTGAFAGDRYFDVFVEYAKAAPDDLLVRIRAANPGRTGTKAAAHYRLTIDPGATATLRLRLTAGGEPRAEAFADFDAVFDRRLAEADAFYAAVQPPGLSEDRRRIQRQAFAGVL